MRLMLEGAVALARVEANGIRIDTGYLQRAIDRTAARIKEYEEELKESDVYRIWRKQYGTKTSLGSRDQLKHVLFKEMGFECMAQTASGDDQLDKKALESTELPWAATYIKNEELKKAHSTYLLGIMRAVADDGRLHAFIDLHTTVTYRSSSNSPNIQNMPLRNPVIGKLIRRSFVASPGCRIVEIDYAAIEVRVAACYHKDPTMLKYIRDGYDMHRDMAIECYKLNALEYKTDEQKKLLKACRQQAKALFVFAEFYGDYYISCAKALWEAIDRHKLLGADGAPLSQHLRENGIRKLGECNPKQRPQPGTFEEHIKKVEDRFWGERFPIYDDWRGRWWNKYQERGWFPTLTGFVIGGVWTRNEVINSPVQGSAFHCLLQALILIQKECKRRGLKVKIIGQIHDSLLADCPEEELDEFCQLSKEIMTVTLRELWPWIITPLEVEAEASPTDGSWHDKQPVKL